MKRKNILLCLAFIAGLSGYTQTTEDIYKKAFQYKREYKYIESLAYFQQLLKSDSSNAEYLSNTSIALCRVGHIQPTEEARQNFYHKAEYLAKKAIETDNNQAEPYFAYALALGRLNENASSKERIANAKILKAQIDQCLHLNPGHAAAYHILGRWHSGIAGLTAVEKVTVNTLFGGMPEGGSYDAAIDAYKKSIEIEPNYILHHYDLAGTYLARNAEGDKELAKAELKLVLALPSQTPEDPSTKEKAKEELKKF